MASWNGEQNLVAGVFAAIGASVCCVAPFVLLSLGIGGAWVGSLTAMAPFRTFFMGLTLLFLGLTFRNLYRVSPLCAPGTPCADARIIKRQRLTFWVVATLLFGLLAVPSLVPLFY